MEESNLIFIVIIFTILYLIFIAYTNNISLKNKNNEYIKFCEKYNLEPIYESYFSENRYYCINITNDKLIDKKKIIKINDKVVFK